MNETTTQLFARFATEMQPADVPADVREAACLHLLDTLGCGVAGTGLGAAPYALALAKQGPAGPASAIGNGAKVSAATAAFANGITCHALDFDDTHPASIAHVSAVVVPAALGAAEERRVAGRDLLMALIVGNEITCRVGRPAGDAFHLRGFHPTAICGVFGATAAVARLYELGFEKAVHALGIAGSMAAGIMAYLTDGSETKRIHPGWMAHAAHAAVALAAHGASGPAAVLEGRNGVYSAFIGRAEVDPEEVAGDLSSCWETLSIALKPYPACHFVHAPLDALGELMSEHRFDAQAIERITVFSPQAGIDLVCHPPERKRRPATPYESKFSAPFAIGALLHQGKVDPSTFTEPLMRDPDVLAVADRVDYQSRDYDTFPESLPGGVRVELRSGEVLERHLLHQRGGLHNEMAPADVSEKYRSNARLALADEPAARLEQAVLGLDDEPNLETFGLLGTARPAETP